MMSYYYHFKDFFLNPQVNRPGNATDTGSNPVRLCDLFHAFRST